MHGDDLAGAQVEVLLAYTAPMRCPVLTAYVRTPYAMPGTGVRVCATLTSYALSLAAYAWCSPDLGHGAATRTRRRRTMSRLAYATSNTVVPHAVISYKARTGTDRVHAVL